MFVVPIKTTENGFNVLPYNLGLPIEHQPKLLGIFSVSETTLIEGRGISFMVWATSAYPLATFPYLVHSLTQHLGQAQMTRDYVMPKDITINRILLSHL
ncbi:hypothetical protein M0804_010614 [Polistes exclamans]|nr:hypothetical protein M0804_010614 [Polistes exclamans]